MEPAQELNQRKGRVCTINHRCAPFLRFVTWKSRFLILDTKIRQACKRCSRSNKHQWQQSDKIILDARRHVLCTFHGKSHLDFADCGLLSTLSGSLSFLAPRSNFMVKQSADPRETDPFIQRATAHWKFTALKSSPKLPTPTNASWNLRSQRFFLTLVKMKNIIFRTATGDSQEYLTLWFGNLLAWTDRFRVVVKPFLSVVKYLRDNKTWFVVFWSARSILKLLLNFEPFAVRLLSIKDGNGAMKDFGWSTKLRKRQKDTSALPNLNIDKNNLPKDRNGFDWASLFDVG